MEIVFQIFLIALGRVIFVAKILVTRGGLGQHYLDRLTKLQKDLMDDYDLKPYHFTNGKRTQRRRKTGDNASPTSKRSSNNYS